MGEILVSKEGETLPSIQAEQALVPQPVIGLGEQPVATVPVVVASGKDAAASAPSQGVQESYQEMQEALAVMGELLEQDVEEEEEEPPAKPRVLSKEEIQAGSSQEAKPVVSSQPAPQPPAGTKQPGAPNRNRNGLVRFL